MKDDTRYICPKCWKALRFWSVHSGNPDIKCACHCETHGCLLVVGSGLNAKSAWEDWKHVNGVDVGG